MKKFLITYGDQNFEMPKKRFIQQAYDINVFDEIIAYSEEDLSEELKNSEIIKEKRGGGLWSWKSDVILTTLNKMSDGDYLVYCDAGCTLAKCIEWDKFWSILADSDIIAQRIYQKTEHWTRKNIINYFHSTNRRNWDKCYQYLATVVILKATPFTRRLIAEWRNLVLSHSEMVKDVTPTEREGEFKTFRENRHDQAIFSALIYKYLNKPETKKKIHTQWEHIEDKDIFFKQAIRATRLRNGEIQEGHRTFLKTILKRIIKSYIYRPFFYSQRQWWYSKF